MATSIFTYLTEIIYRTKGVAQAKKDVETIDTTLSKVAKKNIFNTPIFGQSAVKDINQVSTAINDIGKKGEAAKSPIEQLSLALRRAAIVAPVWMALRAAMQGVFNLIVSQTKFLIDLENAMTRIKIVGKGTQEEYDNLQGSLLALSSAYGIAASEALDAAVIFAQQGRTVNETIALTRAAMIGAQVLGIDIKTTVDNITAAVEGFGLSVDKSTNIIDAWINVEKQFAVTAQDLADATKVSGASANQLGITLAEFLGDVTAVIEVTRKSGSEAARGLSFVYARLLTSARPVVEQIAKIPFFLDAQGKATSVLTDKTRSQADILGDLAYKWSSLTELERLNIATSLGSKKQMTTLNALMQNYTASIDARIVAVDSANSAEKAFNLVQDTTSFKLKQLGNAWNLLTVSLGDTTPFKDSIGALDQLVLAFASLIDYGKAYAAVYARQNQEQIFAIEARQNEISNIEELIKIKQKLAAAPQTEENIDRLNKVNEVIQRIAQNQPDLRLAINEEDLNTIRTKVKALGEDEALNKIKIQVEAQFITEEAGLRESIKRAKESLNVTGKDILTPFSLVGKGIQAAINFPKLKENEEKLKTLSARRTSEIEKQVEEYKKQQGIQEIRKSLAEDELNLSEQLDEQELEKLEIDRQIIALQEIYSGNQEEILSKQIDIVRNSQFQYDKHAKNLAIAELENKLYEERIKKLDIIRNNELDILRINGASEVQIASTISMLAQLANAEGKVPVEKRLALEKAITSEIRRQQGQLEDLAIQYAKAETPDERERIRRQMKFLAQTPNQQLFDLNRASGDYRKELLDTVNMLSAQTQQAFSQSIIRRENLPELPSYVQKDLEIQARNFAAQKAPEINTTIQGFNVNVNGAATKEEAIKNMITTIEDYVRNSPDFDKLFNDKVEKF